jgi:hypothetical protein
VLVMKPQRPHTSSTSSVFEWVTFTIGSGPFSDSRAISVSPFKLARRTLYLSCELTGATPEYLAGISLIKEDLEKEFNVLPSAFDYVTGEPLDDPEEVIEHCAKQIMSADVVIIILNGDCNQTGLDITSRMIRGSPEQKTRTLIFHAASNPPPEIYVRYENCGAFIYPFDSLNEIPKLVIAHFAF